MGLAEHDLEGCPYELHGLCFCLGSWWGLLLSEWFMNPTPPSETAKSKYQTLGPKTPTIQHMSYPRVLLLMA